MPNDSASNAFVFLTPLDIKVGGTSIGADVRNLTLTQRLAHASQFSFIWRQEQVSDASISHVDFFRKNLGKTVVLLIGKEFTFNGYITTINLSNHQALGVEYEIGGSGNPIKMEDSPHCGVHVDKSMVDIIKSVCLSYGLNVDTGQLAFRANSSTKLPYTVQYNQSSFNFLTMLAARYGEWIYYNGEKICVGKPSDSPIKLEIDSDLFDFNLSGVANPSYITAAAFDLQKSVFLSDAAKTPQLGDLSKAINNAAVGISGKNGTFHALASVNEVHHKQVASAQHQANIANQLHITGTTAHTGLKLMSKISIKDGSNNLGNYIITEIQHFCGGDQNYSNHFVAIPDDLEVPPYANATHFPMCTAQSAVVVDNEDPDKLDRVKVRFAWMEGETPWIPVLTPHAGKDKGMRFLPEINDEVIVNFLGNHAEKPFLMGAVYTEKNQSGTLEKGNHIKGFGTKTGRRYEVNDDAGTLKIYDNFEKSKPQNLIHLERNDESQFIKIDAQDSGQECHIELKRGGSTNVITIKVGDLSAEFDAKAQKITLKSGGSIAIEAVQEISFSAQTINMKAQKDIAIGGASAKVKVNGVSVALEGTASFEAKGATAKISGMGTAELSGGAMTTIKGGIVMIN